MIGRIGWLEIIFLLALGVTAHDFASYYGFHIPGVHAFDFSIPLMGILIGLMLRKWWKYHKTK